MRTDFRSVLTHGKALRYPDAQRFPAPILDDDGVPVRPFSRARDLRKGWCEGSNLRYPLVRRYLAAQVGRPWDAVHSELCHALEPAIRRRVVDHVVEENCTLSPCEGVLDELGRPVSGLYVHPRDGTLRSAPGQGWSASYRLRRRRARLVDPDAVPLTAPDDPHRQVSLRRIEGVWYALSWTRSEERIGSRCQEPIRPVRRGEPVTVFESFHAKRQLAGAEIRRLRLAEWADGASRLAGAVSAGRDDPRLAGSLEAIREAAAACLRREGPPAPRR